jgi:hypothetical protein
MIDLGKLMDTSYGSVQKRSNFSNNSNANKDGQ